MQIKANFHFHTGDDPFDVVDYSTEQGIDHVANSGFNALALTAHRSVLWTPNLASYAASKDVLLISGIELNVGDANSIYGRHVVVLNADKRAENIITFEDLRAYKRDKPDIFILAVHPYFYGGFSLKEYLEKHIDLFDAIEISWFYSKFFNRNKRAIRLAKKYKKPLIATSDTHFFRKNHLERGYVIVEALENTSEAIFSAILKGDYKNVSRPGTFWGDMVFLQGKFFLRDYFKKRSLRKEWRAQRKRAFSNK